MCMGSSRAYRALAILTLLGATAAKPDERSWLNVNFPRDSPVDVVSFNLGDSTASVSGISLALALHTSLTLRNTSNKRVRGLTLLVQAEDLTSAGRGSVTVPSLNVMPGEIFPVRINLELLRPFNTTRNGGALVEVTLDCVLFDDLSAYGPDKLRSRRNLIVYEREAERDRKYFRNLIETGQTAKLQEEMNFGLPDVRPPELGFELLNGIHRDTSPSRPVSVSIVPFPDAPVQMLNGAARIYRNEVHAPELDVRNQTKKMLQNVEVGWILRDENGRNYVAGSLPANVAIGPVQQVKVLQGAVLRFSHASGRPMLVDAVMAYISNVQFSDGDLWIPSRGDIANTQLDASVKRALASSPETQRLSEIYRRRGISGLTAELLKSPN